MIVDVLTGIVVENDPQEPARYLGSITVRLLWTHTHIRQASMHSGISHMRITDGWWATLPERPSGYFELPSTF